MIYNSVLEKHHNKLGHITEGTSSIESA